VNIIWLMVATFFGAPYDSQPPAVTASQSVYTSVRARDCQAPSRDAAAAFKARGVTAQRCPGIGGWRVFVVASDANSWLELRSEKVEWSSETAVVYDSPIGLFPSAGASPRIEWRRPPQGTPTALIFRVSAQDPTDTAKRVSRLFVVRLEPARACVIGRVATNDEARALADGPTGCATAVPL
jgi:hypothetical protein